MQTGFCRVYKIYVAQYTHDTFGYCILGEVIVVNHIFQYPWLMANVDLLHRAYLGYQTLSMGYQTLSKQV